MTVPAQSTLFNESTANGLTTSFPYEFKIASADDITVELNGVAQSTGFSITGVGEDVGGSVVFSVAPANGVTVLRYLDPVFNREENYPQFGDFSASVVNLDFDRIWLALQALLNKIGRAPKLPINSPLDEPILPDPVAWHVLGWNSAADGIRNYGPVDNTLLTIALSAPAGASLVGYLPAGTGAVTRTVAEKLQETQHPDDYATFANFTTETGPGKGLFTDWNIVPGETEAGRIRYVRDRLMVGDAANYDGLHWHDTIPGTVQGDGTLDGQVAGVSFLTNRLKGAFQYLEHQSQAAIMSARGYTALTVATQSSDLTGNGAPIGIASVAIGNKAGTTQGAWAYYGVAIRDTVHTTGPGAFAAELHVSNMVNDAPQWDGYSASPNGMTSVLHLAQGGEHTQADAGNLTDYDVTSCINITRFKGVNGGAFLKGIIFHKQALAGCDGATGIGIAMDLAKGHQIQWRSAAGDAGLSSLIRCDANGKYVAPLVVMSSNTFSIKQRKSDDAELNAFMVLLPTLAAGEEVNGLYVNCTKTGQGHAYLSAHGVDANIDLNLVPKGIGLIKTGYSTSAATTPANFSATRRLAFRDSSGTTYYIPCSSTPW